MECNGILMKSSVKMGPYRSEAVSLLRVVLPPAALGTNGLVLHATVTAWGGAVPKGIPDLVARIVTTVRCLWHRPVALPLGALLWYEWIVLGNLKDALSFASRLILGKETAHRS